MQQSILSIKIINLLLIKIRKIYHRKIFLLNGFISNNLTKMFKWNALNIPIGIIIVIKNVIKDKSKK